MRTTGQTQLKPPNDILNRLRILCLSGLALAWYAFRIRPRMRALGGSLTSPVSTLSQRVADAVPRSPNHGGNPAVVKCVLLVDPTRSMLLRLGDAIQSEVRVIMSDTFDGARRSLLSHAPHLLVTNLRLQAHNGLHLVYLAAAAGFPTRAVVYADPHDAGLFRDAQAAGAFYERPDTLLPALDAYIRATLPQRDRRGINRVSRRGSMRAASRASDLIL